MANNRFSFWTSLLSALLGGVCLLTGSSLAAQAPQQSWDEPAILAALPGAVGPNYLPEHPGQLPVFFTKAEGNAGYVMHGSRHAAWFTDAGIDLALRRAAGEEAAPLAVSLRPRGIQQGLKPEGVDPQPGKVHFYLGKDEGRWRRHLAAYGAVLYPEAYPGIDLKFYGAGAFLEYDAIIRPGGRPDQVRFEVRGAQGLELTESGDLKIMLPGEETLYQKKPRLFQEIAGRRVDREGGFKIYRNRPHPVYGFKVAAYDQRYPLIIDPELVFSTYLGGKNNDSLEAVGVDQAGNVYVAGYTLSNFLKNPKLPYRGSYDGLVAKLSPDGRSLLYATYLGGASEDYCLGLAVDRASGCAFVTGSTASADFPLKFPLYGVYKGGFDAFVTKLNADGTLNYSTYLGGTGDEEGYAIAVDNHGQAYVTGYTDSTDFPTSTNAFHPALNNAAGQNYYDIFVTKLAAGGQNLLYSTYLGGKYLEWGHAIAVDAQECAYVAGSSQSPDFPQQSPLFGATPPVSPFFDHAIAAKINTVSGDLEYSTYLWGNDYDHAMAVAVDGQGRAFVAGMTASDDFLGQNHTVAGAFDAYVARLDFNGSALSLEGFAWLAGAGSDRIMGLALNDLEDTVYAVGDTDSATFLGQTRKIKPGYPDVFVAKLPAELSNPTAVMFLGGSGIDYGRSVSFHKDTSGNFVCVAGATTSRNFPLKNALYPTLSGAFDGFVAKIKD